MEIRFCFLIWVVATQVCSDCENSMSCIHLETSQLALVVKNPPANAGDVRDESLIPGSGRAPREGHGNLLQYSCLGNPWTEETGGLGLQFMGSQRVGHD